MTLRLTILLLLALGVGAQAGTWYIAPAATGSGSGADSSDCKAYTFFSSSGNWGSGAGKINPGDTIYAEGNITNQLQFNGNGTPGNPTTLIGDAGSEMVFGCFPSSGAVYMPSGTHDVRVTGLFIENTNNGDGLGCTNAANGGLIYGGSSSYAYSDIEVDHNTLLNQYVHAYGSPNGGGAAIWFTTAVSTNLWIHDNVITNACDGISIQTGASTATCSNCFIFHNFIGRCNWGIGISIGTANLFSQGIYIYSNHISDGYAWDTGTGGSHDNFHNNGIMVFCGLNSEPLTNVFIFDNYIGPRISQNGNATSWIFLDNNGSPFVNCWVYNNVLVASNGDNCDNAMVTGGGRPLYYLNNSCYAPPGTTINAFGGADSGETSYYTNNICQVTGTYIGDNAGSTGYADYNDFYGSSGNTASGNSHSISSNPQFTSPSTGNLALSSGSPCITAGVNLSGYFTADANGNARQGGAWDMGALFYQSGMPAPGPVNAAVHW
jgi:hypothetical protein